MKAINKKVEGDKGVEIKGFCKISGELCVLSSEDGLWRILRGEEIEIQDDQGNVLTAPESPAASFLNWEGDCTDGDKEFNKFIISKCPKPKKSKDKE